MPMLIIAPIDIEELVKNALATVDKRSAQILKDRYGLISIKPKTLAEIGANYSLTRERVRQIESRALAAARERIASEAKARALARALNDYLDSVGHVRRADYLAHDLMILWGATQALPIFSNYLIFLAEVLETPRVIYAVRDFHGVWHNDQAAFAKAKKLADHLHGLPESDFDDFLKFAKKKFDLDDILVMNYLTISKNFAVGPYGDLGPKHWVTVNPKTVRERAYLVLERRGEPLHFSAIAAEVNKIGGVYRSPATVHNELIKDPRFVLVERGTYDIKS